MSGGKIGKPIVVVVSKTKLGTPPERKSEGIVMAAGCGLVNYKLEKSALRLSQQDEGE
jgi:hypothetical protein